MCVCVCVCVCVCLVNLEVTYCDVLLVGLDGDFCFGGGRVGGGGGIQVVYK